MDCQYLLNLILDLFVYVCRLLQTSFLCEQLFGFGFANHAVYDLEGR